MGFFLWDSFCGILLKILLWDSFFGILFEDPLLGILLWDSFGRFLGRFFGRFSQGFFLKRPLL